jgi:hypothetical protein
MINGINITDNCYYLPSLVDLELLEVLLEPENDTYPWNPADEISEVYFHRLEQKFGWENLPEEELTTSATNFFRHLDMIWSLIPNSPHHNSHDQLVNYIQKLLDQNFSISIPTNWLDTIFDKATELLTLEQSASEKLVKCVQTLLPNLGIDDFSVFTRPYAYEMRSKAQSLESNLSLIINNSQHQDWDSLSEIEQAKISLAIADFVFQQLDSFQNSASGY